MGVLYYLSPPKDGKKILTALQGDFAVRTFASWASFVKLSSLHNSFEPDGILVALPEKSFRLDPADTYLGERFPDSLRVYFTEADQVAVLQQKGRFVFDLAMDSLKLSAVIKRLLEVKQGDRDVLCYKDLRLDIESLFLSQAESDVRERLTLKEGQLLRYLLRHPGRLVQRSELIAEVWNQLKVSPRTIDSQISKLRRRLRSMSVSIESVYGGGYILK